MIVWGGNFGYNFFNTGGIYDPQTNTWTPTSTVNAPIGRSNTTAIWTGSKMIVWGGWIWSSSNYTIYNTGGIYDPQTNTWTPTSTVNAPSERSGHIAVWTGSKMIVWGGNNTTSGPLDTGGIYDPQTNTWTPTSTVNAPDERAYHTAVWTGSKMIVWGGRGTNNPAGGLLLFK
jgi:N-acetylneuraminic acid mutarotase